MSPVVGAAPAPVLRGGSRFPRRPGGGQPPALEELFRDYQPRLLSYCRRMLGNEQEAEDAVQLTFMAAHLQLAGEAVEVNIGAWLFTVARRKCVDVLRRRRNDTHLGSGHASAASPSAEVEQREDLRRVVADVRRLDDAHRAALVLTQIEGLSQAEVAGVLGTHEARVRRLVFEARQSLVDRREARHLTCRAVREELAGARGSQFRRRHLVVHCEECEECRAYRAGLLAQRPALRAILPLIPLFLTAKRAWASVPFPRRLPGRILRSITRVPAPGLATMATVGAFSVAGAMPQGGSAPYDDGIPASAGGRAAPPAASVRATQAPPPSPPRRRPRRPVPARHVPPVGGEASAPEAASIAGGPVPAAPTDPSAPAAPEAPAAEPGGPSIAPGTATVSPGPVVSTTPLTAPATTPVSAPATTPTTTATESTPVVTVTPEATPTVPVVTAVADAVTPTTTPTEVPDDDRCSDGNNGTGRGDGCTPNGDPNGDGSPGNPGGDTPGGRS